MPSAIDFSKPIFGTPSTQSVRDNFHHASNEISELQEIAYDAVRRSGDLMTGPLFGMRDPIAPIEFTTRRWVLNQILSTVNTLVFVGSYDAEHDAILTSNSDRFPTGSPLPPPEPVLSQMYVISRTASPPGHGIGNQPEGGVPAGCWLICNGESWNIWVGDVPEGVTAQTIAIDPPIPNVPATNVYQAFEIIGDHWYDYQYYVEAHRFWPYLIVENFFTRNAQYGFGFDDNAIWFGEREEPERRVTPPKPGTIMEIPDPPVNEYPLEEFDPLWKWQFDKNVFRLLKKNVAEGFSDYLILGEDTDVNNENLPFQRGLYIHGGKWVMQIANGAVNNPGFEIWSERSVGNWNRNFRIDGATGNVTLFGVDNQISNSHIYNNSFYGSYANYGAGLWANRTEESGDAGSHIGLRSGNYAADPRAVQVYTDVSGVGGYGQKMWAFRENGWFLTPGEIETPWHQLNAHGIHFKASAPWGTASNFVLGYGLSGVGLASVSINGGGHVYFIANGGDICDERLKTDIKPSKVNCLNVVKQIDLYSFIRKTIPDVHHIEKYNVQRDVAHAKSIGMVAQKLQKIFPEAVNKGDTNIEGKIGWSWTLDFGVLISLLIGSVQQLNEEIAQLKGAK